MDIKSISVKRAARLSMRTVFSTGDVATLDGEGFMQITDRAKDVIKSGGEWISSIDLGKRGACPSGGAGSGGDWN